MEIFTATQKIASLGRTEFNRRNWIPKIACLLCPITVSWNIVICTLLPCIFICDAINIFVPNICCNRKLPILSEEPSLISKTSIYLRICKPEYAVEPCSSENFEYLSSPERQEMNTSQQVVNDIPRIRIAHAIKESLPIPDLLDIIVQYADENLEIPQNTGPASTS